MNFLYWIVVAPIRGWRLLSGCKIYGVENLPKSGPAVCVANHIYAWDICLLVTVWAHRQINFLAKKELTENPLLKYPLRYLGVIGVDRGNTAISTIRDSLSLLKKGAILGIFPEGTRNRNKKVPVLPFKPGAVLIAAKGSAPIVPVALLHTENFFAFWRKERPVAVVGRPIDLPSGKLNQEDLASYSQMVQDEVEKLLYQAKGI